MIRYLIVCLACLALSCSSSTAREKSVTPSVLFGRVQRVNKEGVPNAWVVLVEEPKRSPLDLTLKDSRKIAATKTDGGGRFEIKVSSIANRKLILSVLGEPVVRHAGGMKEVTGTDVGITNISTERTNVIVVPNDFKPSSKAQTLQSKSN